MMKKTLFAAAVIGGAMLAVAAPASAGEVGHHPGGGISIGDNLCAAPWQWNGPIEALHAGHAPSYAACNNNSTGGGHGGISILDNACLLPWQWNGPLELLTVDHNPSYVACNGNSAG
ncbi:hypothetical protein ACFVYA_48820 [Amycolatopsis sp. NPDC058278]|uniref:hypothetical protein n=1 Tax=unclassified Amycolatopsis TaxID=2618356 RepID=UPI00255BA4F2|nr:hypothetical protein [Amycolatopsis sp. DG1A-15b]WIX85431.1 hypothetical protein QRY02_29880 [Amycolatopsis sp. DG1A-15b]